MGYISYLKPIANYVDVIRIKFLHLRNSHTTQEIGQWRACKVIFRHQVIDHFHGHNVHNTTRAVKNWTEELQI